MAWTDFAWYGGAFLDAFGAAGLDLTSGDVKAALVDNTYTPNQDTHTHLDDLTGELSGGGYARVTLASPSISYDAGSNTFTFDADPFTFATLTGDFRHVVLFLDTGVAGTSTLIAFSSEDTADVSSSGQDVTITPNASGLCYVTLS